MEGESSSPQKREQLSIFKANLQKRKAISREEKLAETNFITSDQRNESKQPEISTHNSSTSKSLDSFSVNEEKQEKDEEEALLLSFKRRKSLNKKKRLSSLLSLQTQSLQTQTQPLQTQPQPNNQIGSDDQTLSNPSKNLPTDEDNN